MYRYSRIHGGNVVTIKLYNPIMARKDAENLLRNLYCFLEILQTSRSKEVSSWDRQSLDNAVKWADFAEQVKAQGI